MQTQKANLQRIPSLKLFSFMLLDMLKDQPKTSSQLRETIQDNFGLNIRPLQIYSSLKYLKKQGYLKIGDTIDCHGYTKLYYLTIKGVNFLLSAETSLQLSCQNLVRAENLPASTFLV
jgi:DNA-binding PadR family transcriptional regulator